MSVVSQLDVGKKKGKESWHFLLMAYEIKSNKSPT
jgi:hypothetical protein